MTEVKLVKVTPAEFSAETLAYIHARSRSVAQASDKLRLAHECVEAWLGSVITESGVLPDGTDLHVVECERGKAWSLAGSRSGELYLLTDYEDIRDRENPCGSHWVRRGVLVEGTRKLPAHLAAYAEKLRAAEKEYKQIATLAEEMAKLLMAANEEYSDPAPTKKQYEAGILPLSERLREDA